MSQKRFSEVLLAAIDESLSSLGDSPKQAILFHLETSFKIKKERIPENITEFAKALEKIFGPGANYLEKLILTHLSQKLGLKFESLEVENFPELVEGIKKRQKPAEEYVFQ